MVHFNIGDRVRVSAKLPSEHAGAMGIIVAIQQEAVGAAPVAECEVEFMDGIGRRFLSVYLTVLDASQC